MLEYDKCFLINLDRHPDRLKHMAQFKDLFKFERFKAFDGLEMDRDNLPFGLKIPDITFKNAPGRLGCWLSHYALWRKIASSDISTALILEDDILMFKHLAYHAKVLNEAVKEADILYLGCGLLHHFQEKIPIYPHRLPCIYRVEKPLGTYAYLIRNEAAAKLVSQLAKDGIKEVIDQQMRTANLDLQVCLPPFCRPIVKPGWSSTDQIVKASAPGPENSKEQVEDGR